MILFVEYQDVMKKMHKTVIEKFDKCCRRLYIVLFSIALLTIIPACTDDDYRRLEEVEGIIETEPQKAFSDLQSIDMESLHTAKSKAKYALLMSMALDKNYVDKTDFEIIQPAVDYYLRRGSPTDRLRTLLYEGRIYYNAGDSESAMGCYTRALDYAPRCNDRHCLSRVYGSQAVVYRSLFNLDRAVESAERAASIMKEIGDTTNYFLELNTIVSNLIHLDEKERALEYLKECDSLWYNSRLSSKRDYFGNKILYARRFQSIDESLDYVDKYLEAIPGEYVNWITIADAYYYAGDIPRSEEAMANYDRFGGRQTAGVEAMRAQIKEAKGDYREALAHYRQYIHLSDSADLVAYRHNTRAVPELHELEVEREKMRQGRLHRTVLLFAVLLLLVLSWVVYRQRNEMSRLHISQLEEEFESLKELRQSEASAGAEARSVLDERLSLLNRFFKAYISEDVEEEKRAYRQIESLLEDRQNFTASTRKAFEASRPEFIHYLEERGLNGKEINYCCLYALGLKGNEVGQYMKDSRHYHVSSEIRSKLGLSSNDTNLGLFLRDLASARDQAE